MIRIENIEKEVNIFYLKGVSLIENPLLNIIKMKDGKLYLERIIEDEYVVSNKYKTESYLIHLYQEITVEKIKEIFNKDNLLKNYYGPTISEICTNPWKEVYIYMDKSELLLKINSNHPKFKEVENIVQNADNHNLFSTLNWTFDEMKKEDILSYILNKLELN